MRSLITCQQRLMFWGPMFIYKRTSEQYNDHLPKTATILRSRGWWLYKGLMKKNCFVIKRQKERQLFVKLYHLGSSDLITADRMA